MCQNCSASTNVTTVSYSCLLRWTSVIHVPRCGQRSIIVLKIVVTIPHTLKINFHLLRKTPVSEWSQTLLNEILKYKHFSSLSHNTSWIALLILAGDGINHVTFLACHKSVSAISVQLCSCELGYIRQGCESFLNCEPHKVRYICGQRENYLIINMVLHSLLQIKKYGYFSRNKRYVSSWLERNGIPFRARKLVRLKTKKKMLKITWIS